MITFESEPLTIIVKFYLNIKFNDEYIGSIFNECCSEVCYALWIVEVCETIEYIMINNFSQLVRIDIVLFVLILLLLCSWITPSTMTFNMDIT